MAAAEDPGSFSEGQRFTEDRLDSWKDIASYLRRSERTVRRWEHTLRLPVHRLPGAKRATIFALKSELDDWWQACDRETGESAADGLHPGERHSRAWLYMAGLLVAASAVFAVARVAIRPASSGRPLWRQITFDTGSTSEPAISRDGKLIVYSSDRGDGGDQDIYAQRLQGGHPVRLTNHSARDCRPDIAPDGSLVVFHSYRDGGGIYRVGVRGEGEVRLAGGDFPRFSPDGARVAFENELPDGTFAIFAVPASGGPVTRVTPPAFRQACLPLWSPDGKSILFVGSTHARPQEYDWWAVASGGGEPVRTGVSAQLIRQGWQGLRFFHAPLDWSGNRVVFFYSVFGSPNLWRIPLSPGTFKVAGVAEQLTSGTGTETHLRTAAISGKKHVLVAAAGSSETQVWEFAADPERGVVAERGRQLTQDTSILPQLAGTRPSLSANGDLLVYASRRTGNSEVWLQDLNTRAERPITTSPQNEVHPIIARDGSAVIFMRPEGDKRALILTSIDGSQPRRICDDCGTPTDWSPDGRYVMYVSKVDRLGLLDVMTGVRSELPSSVPLLSGTFSPDGRTVAVGARFGEKESAYLLPFEGRRWPPENLWKPLSHLSASAVVWSPTGKLAYFLSVEDQYRCLWAQRVDPATRQTIGTPLAIKHFHTLAQYPKMSRWVAVARNKLILRLTCERSNIWSAEID